MTVWELNFEVCCSWQKRKKKVWIVDSYQNFKVLARFNIWKWILRIFEVVCEIKNLKLIGWFSSEILFVSLCIKCSNPVVRFYLLNCMWPLHESIPKILIHVPISMFIHCSRSGRQQKNVELLESVDSICISILIESCKKQRSPVCVKLHRVNNVEADDFPCKQSSRKSCHFVSIINIKNNPKAAEK